MTKRKAGHVARKMRTPYVGGKHVLICSNGRPGRRLKILKLAFKEEEGRKWTEIIWLKIGTRSRL